MVTTSIYRFDKYLEACRGIKALGEDLVLGGTPQLCSPLTKKIIKTMKEKSFFDFSKGSLEPSFSGQLDLSGFPSKVKVQIGMIN